jgi:hypothetical protein
LTAQLTARGLSFRALAFRFDVSGEDEPLLERVASSCRDLAVVPQRGKPAAAAYHIAHGSTRDTRRLLFNGQPVAAEASRSHVLAMLLWHVNVEATQRTRGTHTVLHAAAAARGGQAIVLPAPMDSGKTTIVAGLVQDGFGYLTDEAAAVSVDDLHVEPFPKSLSIDAGSWAVLAPLRDHDVGQLPAQWIVPVSSLQSGWLATRTPVAAVVVPRYQRGAKTALEPMPRSEAVVAMASAAFNFDVAPEAHLDVFSRIAGESGCYRLTIGSLPRAVELISDLMENNRDG